MRVLRRIGSIWHWRINRTIIVMIWKSEDGTPWESAKNMTDQCILNAAGWIASKFWLSQLQIDLYKYAILGLLREKPVCSSTLATILSHIRDYREQVVKLLDNKPCIRGYHDRAQSFVSELVYQIERVLESDCFAGGSELLDTRALKNRRHTFPLEDNEKLVVFPVKWWFKVQINQRARMLVNYFCADYSVHRDESWRHIITYNCDGERIDGYTAFDSPKDERRRYR